MAADHSHMECPDPSAHEKHNKLSEQASTAALYVTDPSRGTNPRENVQRNVLDSNGKLSSSSAATSLKYAKAQDLPSFPSVGISTSSAGAAAMLAKDYKMKELWQPEDSAAGSKAALLAAQKGAKLDLWEPSASKDGNSAATLAMRNKTLSPQLDRGYTPQGRNNALLAATKSQRQSRQRAGSTPSPAPALYPDQKNSAFNALNAATVSHRGSVRSPPPAVASKEGPGAESEAMQAARIHNISKNINPEMWGERPPVEIELEDQKQKAALRASAVSMAKQMYEYQNRTVLGPDLTGTAGAEAAQSRPQTSTAPADLKQEALRYIHLQDAARTLADERLAKVDKNFEAARYREYYGYSMQPQRSRLSMRGRTRRRASSEGGNKQQDDSDSDDEVQASRVRRQMSQFGSALADIDAKKQQTDRKALLAAAERNVNKSMNNMDERVFQDTGKISQAKMDEWAAKARQKAQEESEQRNENKGKTHVGGGKFMDQSEIEAIAQARLKPTLDELNDTAEKKRAHDEEMRLEKEEQDRQKIHEKQTKQAEKEEQKQIKNEQKAEKKKEKEERKAAENERKTAESQRKAAEKAEKEDKRKSVEEQQPADNKRKSLLSRLASKRKSRDVKKDDAPETAEGAAAGATGAAGAAAITSSDHEEKESDPSPLEGTTAEVPAIVEPKDSTEEIRPTTTESRPGLAPEHNGSYTDAVPSPRSERKPNLERHISKIESSSGSSLSDSDVDDKEEDKLHKDAPVAAAGASGAAVAAAAPGNDEDHAKTVAERVVSAPVEDTASAATKDSKADARSMQNSTPATAATSSAAPASAPIAKTGPGSTSTDEPRQSTASSRPSEEKEPKGFRGFFSKLRSKSKGDNKLRSEAADVEKVAPTVSGTAAAPREPVTDKPASEPTSTTDASATAPTAAHVGTESAIGTSTLPEVNKAARSISPSSFRRRKSSSSLGDVSSLSSSGLDEDDLVEGRSGRMARALKAGTAKNKGKAKEVDAANPLAKDPVVSGDESDQFEEARDHFDEGLAPQPAFGGQAKSQSPARETRFHEEV